MLPTSSRSGKKTSKVVAPLDSTLCRRSAVSSTLASTITSPVFRSTTSAAVSAPSSSAASTSILSMLAARMAFSVCAVILRPECAISSPLCSTACAGLAPSRCVDALASCGNSPLQLAVGNVDAVDRVEGLENLLVRTQAERAQEDGAQELALAVDANVERVLLVVFELHPRSAIGNDLAQEVGAVVRRLKEDARRTMQLRNDDAFGAVHDERAVRRHQRNVAEEDFLLLDVADGLVAGLRDPCRRW